MARHTVEPCMAAPCLLAIPLSTSAPKPITPLSLALRFLLQPSPQAPARTCKFVVMLSLRCLPYKRPQRKCALSNSRLRSTSRLPIAPQHISLPGRIRGVTLLYGSQQRLPMVPTSQVKCEARLSFPITLYPGTTPILKWHRANPLTEPLNNVRGPETLNILILERPAAQPCLLPAKWQGNISGDPTKSRKAGEAHLPILLLNKPWARREKLKPAVKARPPSNMTLVPKWAARWLQLAAPIRLCFTVQVMETVHPVTLLLFLMPKLQHRWMLARHILLR